MFLGLVSNFKSISDDHRNRPLISQSTADPHPFDLEGIRGFGLGACWLLLAALWAIGTYILTRKAIVGIASSIRVSGASFAFTTTLWARQRAPSSIYPPCLKTPYLHPRGHSRERVRKDDLHACLGGSGLQQSDVRLATEDIKNSSPSHHTYGIPYNDIAIAKSNQTTYSITCQGATSVQTGLAIEFAASGGGRRYYFWVAARAAEHQSIEQFVVQLGSQEERGTIGDHRRFPTAVHTSPPEPPGPDSAQPCCSTDSDRIPGQTPTSPRSPPCSPVPPGRTTPLRHCLPLTPHAQSYSSPSAYT